MSYYFFLSISAITFEPCSFLVFRVNLDKLTFDFNIYLPRLSFRGKYDLKIKLLLLNIAGKGDLNGVLGKICDHIKVP